MPADPARARYLADAVATATPARRIVLLYDRLWLDIQRAQAAQDCGDLTARDHLQHAQQILAELLGSLDVTAWTGAADLASLYSYLLRELIGEVIEPRPGRLATVTRIVSTLRESWQQAEAQLQGGTPSADGREAVRVG
ncbi:flagellar export chaperone FliS [Jatrophihabitans sp.]|uniref:flagellar export chaperone FliS n=1 Tax=Jatrophihabitans sp. TaxID=1932789 RepID=UPI002CE2BA59|nr:flagellar export chaperone FliS [Jatrophihabitans sp.]